MTVLSNEIQKYFLFQRQLFSIQNVYMSFFFFFWEGYIWEFNLGT